MTAPIKKNVTIIITRSELGGAQKYVLSMVTELQPYFNFRVITGSNSYLSNKLRALNIEVIIIKQIDSANCLVALIKLRMILKQKHCDLINTHSTLASCYGRIAAIGLKTPLIYSVHGWCFSGNTPWLRRLLGSCLEKLLANITSFWIVETKFDGSIGLKSGAIKKIEDSIAIPNGISEFERKKQLNLNIDDFQLVFIGRVSYQKDPELAIQTLFHLPSQYSLNMYCDNATDKSLLNLIDDLALTKRINLIDDEFETYSVINNFDLLLVTSRYEGMPLSMIEAMSAGLPIVSSDVCGLNELVVNDVNGYLVSTRNPEDYAKRIRAILENKALIKSMRIKAIEKFDNNHKIEIMCSRLKKVFNAVINKNSDKPR